MNSQLMQQDSYLKHLDNIFKKRKSQVEKQFLNHELGIRTIIINSNFFFMGKLCNKKNYPKQL